MGRARLNLEKPISNKDATELTKMRFVLLTHGYTFPPCPPSHRLSLCTPFGPFGSRAPSLFIRDHHIGAPDERPGPGVIIVLRAAVHPERRQRVQRRVERADLHLRARGGAAHHGVLLTAVALDVEELDPVPEDAPVLRVVDGDVGVRVVEVDRLVDDLRGGREREREREKEEEDSGRWTQEWGRAMR